MAKSSKKSEKNTLDKEENAVKVSSDSKSSKTKDKDKQRNVSKSVLISAVAVIIIIIIIATIWYYLTSNYYTTSFSTFKSNFNSAQRVAVVSQFINSSTYSYISQCATGVIDTIVSSNKRNASTIDFYVVNATSCTYAPNGLGHVLNPVNTNATNCEKDIASEPSISLNYSNSNYSQITAYHMTVYGNAAYYSECPIAISLS
ncbi:MAG: hypothetical protein ACP5M9_01840 [Candidatus Micrarchaeia archaeon]